MNAYVAIEMKSIYESACNAFDELERAVGPVADMPLRKVLAINLLKYSFGIIAADGTVTNEEAATIAYIFEDMGLDALSSTDDLVQLIQTIGIEDGVPEIIKVAVQVDDVLAQNGMQRQLASVLVGTFESFGDQLITIDGHEDPRERNLHNQGMQRIKQYVRNYMR